MGTGFSLPLLATQKQHKINPQVLASRKAVRLGPMANPKRETEKAVEDEENALIWPVVLYLHRSLAEYECYTTDLNKQTKIEICKSHQIASVARAIYGVLTFTFCQISANNGCISTCLPYFAS